MSRVEVKFSGNWFTESVEQDPLIPKEEKKRLIAGYGPDAGEFIVREEETEARQD